MLAMDTTGITEVKTSLTSTGGQGNVIVIELNDANGTVSRYHLDYDLDDDEDDDGMLVIETFEEMKSNLSMFYSSVMEFKSLKKITFHIRDEDYGEFDISNFLPKVPSGTVLYLSTYIPKSTLMKDLQKMEGLSLDNVYILNDDDDESVKILDYVDPDEDSDNDSDDDPQEP